MQTFLPYADFKLSARLLDYKRLGKQRVEAMQLISTFLPSYKKKGWINHPARLMWRNNIGSLAEYAVTVCNEWINREYKDTCKNKILNLISELENKIITEDILFNTNYSKPYWFGNIKFHASHRSNLLRKNYLFYSQYGWRESDNLEYIWPK